MVRRLQILYSSQNSVVTRCEGDIVLKEYRLEMEQRKSMYQQPHWSDVHRDAYHSTISSSSRAWNGEIQIKHT